MGKIQVIHFHNGSNGGVLSVIRNLLYYCQQDEIENHVVYTINQDQIVNYKKPNLEGAISEHVFYYSPKWNFYFISRQLSRIITDDKAIIIAHDWLELGMVSCLGLQNPVVQVLHGDYEYYYNLAVKYAINIDSFICIASNIADNLKVLLPDRKENIYYQRFPVGVPVPRADFGGVKRLLFVGRCEQAKGYTLLPVIEQYLRQVYNCRLDWTIVGNGYDIEKFQWPPNSHVKFLNEIPNEEVLALLHEHDLILLPSIAEGMPISIIEAMKSGVVPIVNDIQGGIQELVENNVTGYKIKSNNPVEYASKVKMLSVNLDLLNQLRSNCIERGKIMFNPIQNSKAFEVIYKKTSKKNITKRKIKLNGSRLDEPWIPNILVCLFRNIF